MVRRPGPTALGGRRPCLTLPLLLKSVGSTEGLPRAPAGAAGQRAWGCRLVGQVTWSGVSNHSSIGELASDMPMGWARTSRTTLTGWLFIRKQPQADMAPGGTGHGALRPPPCARLPQSQHAPVCQALSMQKHRQVDSTRTLWRARPQSGRAECGHTNDNYNSGP